MPYRLPLALWRALRAYSLPASVGSVLAGGLAARRADPGGWSGIRLAVAVAAGASLHLAANLWNDLHDWRNGTDRPGASEGSGVLTRRELSPAAVGAMAWTFAALALAAGAWLCLQAGWPLAALGAAGVAAAWFYSAGPRNPKAAGLGEGWAFVWMGLGMALGGAIAASGRCRPAALPAPLLAGLPLACRTALLMAANNWRDAPSDAAAGLRTLAVCHGTAARRLCLVLALATWPAAVLAATLRAVPWAAVLFALPVLPFDALRWRKIACSGRPGPGDVEAVALLQGAFAVLYLAGFLLP